MAQALTKPTTWSTAQVARLTKVTSRRLRHYDQIGLLEPARVGANGYRYYGQAQLRRLQQILLLRELGLGLDAIADVLDGHSDELIALRRHHRWLLAEGERLARLADTVARTIEHLEGGEEMPAEDMFTGFDHNPYEQEARQRWGDEAVDESNRGVRALSPDEQRRVQQDGVEVHQRLAALLWAGTPVDDPAVQEVIADHHAWVSHFWTPNREAYIGLGNLYVDDSRFTDNIDKEQPGLAAYLRDAIAVFAPARLS